MGPQHYYSVSSRTKASPDQKEVDRKRRGARVKCEIKTLKEKESYRVHAYPL